MQSDNKPSIRFKGFTDTWEQRKFDELYTYASEGGTPDTNNGAYYYDAKIPFVKIEDTENKFITDTRSYINEEGLKNSSAWLLPANNVIFTNGATVGNVAINKIPVTTKQGILGIIPSNIITTELMYYLLLSSNFQREVISRMATGTFATIILKNLNEILVTIPKSKIEQERICSLLDRLDTVITLHQRKHHKLINIKKALLQKMFPEDGCDVPKIRFKGFTDTWEQCNWKEKVDILTNMVNPINGEYNNLPHIGPGNIESFTGKLLDNVNTVGDDGLISGKFQFEKDDIIYGKINPQLGKYVYAPYKGLCSADSYVLRGKKGLKQTFLYTILQTDKFYKYSVSVSMRSGMPKINRSELSAFDFIAPSTTEQDKIGTFILSFEKLITLHQRKYEKLINIKKALLQKMFV